MRLQTALKLVYSSTAESLTLLGSEWQIFDAVAAWRSGNDVRRIIEVTLRRARPVPGWVTVFGRADNLGMQSATQTNSASYLRGTGNEYRPQCCDALRLGSKGKMAHSIWGYACGWQVKLCDPLLTRAIPERFRDEFLMIKCYTNLFTLLYFKTLNP